MSRHSITERHLRAMLDVIDEARQDRSGEVPPISLLHGLGRLVPCDLAEFSEVDIPTRWSSPGQAVFFGSDDLPEVDEEIWWRYRHQHAHCVDVERTHGFMDVAQMLDYTCARDIRNLALYTDFLLPYVNQITVPLPAAPGRIRMFHLSREGSRPFNDRDRLTLELMRPHLNAVYHAAARRRREPVRLTRRELDVLRAVANGLGNDAVARQLVVAPSTVRKHLENIYRKLGVSSRTAAVARVFPEPEPYAEPT